MGDNGEVTALRLPNGAEATPEDVSADAAAWATSFARDQRACFAQNHKHDCTATCVKHEPRLKGDDGADKESADDDDSDDDVCDLLAGGGAAFTDNRTTQLHRGQTLSDWLHRGQTLSDMDFYHYAR